MTDQPYRIETDTLAVGMTRSPMFMGVNIRLFFANLMLCALICLDAHTWLGLPLFVVLHLVMAKLSIRDPDFLYVQTKSFIRTPPIFNRYYWGGVNNYEPW